MTILENKIIKKNHKEQVTEGILNLFDLQVNKLVDNQSEAYFSAKLTTSRNICSSQRKVCKLLACSVSLPSIKEYFLCTDFKFFSFNCITQVISSGCL